LAILVAPTIKCVITIAVECVGKRAVKRVIERAIERIKRAIEVIAFESALVVETSASTELVIAVVVGSTIAVALLFVIAV
jgi:hypothetical protein